MQYLEFPGIKAGPCPIVRDIHIHSVMGKTLIENFLCARNRTVKEWTKLTALLELHFTVGRNRKDTR